MTTINPTIEILWDDLYEEVRKVTGYTGHKAALDGSGYRQLGVKESQYELLDRFRDEAVGNVLFQVRRYLHSSTTIDKGIQIDLYMPKNWPLTMKPALKESMESYIINYIISKWLRLSDNSEGVENKPEPKYAADANVFFANIGTILNTRMRPTHPRYLHEYPEEKEEETTEPEE